MPTWVDFQNIQRGENWVDAIQQGLDSCEKMLLIITPEAVESAQVAKEWQYFLEEHKPILPLIVTPAKISFQLRPLQHVDFHNQPYEDALQQLVQALQADQPTEARSPEETRAYEALKNSFRNWVSFGKDDSLLLDRTLGQFLLNTFQTFDFSVDLWQFFLAGVLQHPVNSELPEHLTAALQKLPVESQREIFVFLLRHPISMIRQQSAQLIMQVPSDSLGAELRESLLTETDVSALLWMLRAARKTGAEIPESLVLQPEIKHQWLVRTFLLAAQGTQKPTALFVSDESDLAADLMTLMREIGFDLVTMSPNEALLTRLHAEHVQAAPFEVYDMIVLLRGEHYGMTRDTHLYDALIKYLRQGGLLFASSWVGYESQSFHRLADVLPFTYLQFLENVVVQCAATAEGETLFPAPFSFMTSYESMTVKEDAVVLVQTDQNVPILGYQYVGEGQIYYLNSCQHSCTKIFPSQMRVSEEFRDGMQRLFTSFYQQLQPTI